MPSTAKLENNVLFLSQHRRLVPDVAEWWLQFENPHRIVIPKRGTIARRICCFAAAASRFLADKAGFG